MNTDTPVQPITDKQKEKEEKLKEFTNYFYENLKCVEYEFGLSRIEIANICKTSKAAVTQWFNKTNCPKMESVYLIAKAIHRNPGDFFKKDGIHVDTHKHGPTEKNDTLENTKTYFLENLNKLQTSYGLSKAQIAEICHVSRPTIGQWFHGISWPKLNALFYLTEATNHTVGDLFKKDGIKPPVEPIKKRPNPLKAFKNLSDGTEANESHADSNSMSALIANSELNNAVTPEELSPLERAVIANFRILTPEGKKYILHALTLEAKEAKNNPSSASNPEKQ